MQNLGDTPGNRGEDGMLFSVGPGDLMLAIIGTGNNVYLQDQTLGIYYSGPDERVGAPGAYEGSSICTVEENGSNGAIANFGTVDFQFCRTEVKNTDGTYTTYSLPHVPNASLYRQTEVSTVNPSQDCAFANVPNNPFDPTWPDSSFNVNYEGAGISGC